MLYSFILAALLGASTVLMSPPPISRDLLLPHLPAGSDHNRTSTPLEQPGDTSPPWYDKWDIFPFIEEGNRSLTTLRSGLWADASLKSITVEPYSSRPGTQWKNFTYLTLSYPEPGQGGSIVTYSNDGQHWSKNFGFSASFELEKFAPLKWSPESRPTMEPSEAFRLAEEALQLQKGHPSPMYCNYHIFLYAEDTQGDWPEIVYRFQRCNKDKISLGGVTVGTKSKRVRVT